MPNRGQGLTLTENVSEGFIPRPTLPAQRAVSQLHQMEVLIQGIVSGNYPGLFPTKG
jgi:hypothetical protein